MKLSTKLIKIASILRQASLDIIKSIETTVNQIYMPQIEALNWDSIKRIFEEYLGQEAPAKEDWESFKTLWFSTVFAYKAFEYLKQNEEFLFDEDLRKEFLGQSKLKFYASMLKQDMGYENNEIFKALQKLNQIIPNVFKKQEFRGLMLKILQVSEMENEIREFLKRERLF